MNEKVNNFNYVTILGKERAERTIMSVLGNCIRRAWQRELDDIKYDNVGELRGACRLDKVWTEAEWEQDALDKITPINEVFECGKAFEIREMAMLIIARIYCDNQYNDRQLDKDCLELKQYFERAKK
jgi:hypothetical protein